MSGSGRTIFIAGAGIAGLTLALALAKFGAHVVVLERSETLQEYGAGLQISPNARRVLNQLGLDRAITAKSFEPDGIDAIPYGAEDPLVTMQLGQLVRQKFGAPYAVMHRGDLVEVLFRAAKRFANIDMQFGVTAFDVASHAKGVSVIADQGKRGAREGRGFAFVGADGINSHTRNNLVGGPTASFSDSIAWRVLLDRADMVSLFAMDKTTMLFGPGYHAVVYPLPHRDTVNVALFLKERQKPGSPPDRSEPVLPASRSTSRHFDAIMSLGRGKWGYWPLGTVTAKSWHRESIGLIGDAAHAMFPFQAQGAAMAIEDAAILAPLLMTEPSAEQAFQRYEGLRQARVARVQKLSAGNAFAFHMSGPLTLARNIGVLLQGETGHLKRLDWLYGYDAAPEVDIPAPKRQS